MFPRNSSVLDDRAKVILDRQADILQGYPGLAFTIWGHVDHEEAKQPDGKALGFRRANAVRDYLVGRGIDPARITTDSRSDRAMIVKDRTEKALAVMRIVTTETEDNPRPSK
ncbi:MAG: OmpA family protein [Magnetospirillum sp.]|nr:OmpA family protein [Magnetospirillum sp.]